MAISERILRQTTNRQRVPLRTNQSPTVGTGVYSTVYAGIFRRSLFVEDFIIYWRGWVGKGGESRHYARRNTKLTYFILFIIAP